MSGRAEPGLPTGQHRGPAGRLPPNPVLFLPNGELPVVGSLFRNPDLTRDLAASLRAGWCQRQSGYRLGLHRLISFAGRYRPEKASHETPAESDNGLCCLPPCGA